MSLKSIIQNAAAKVQAKFTPEKAKFYPLLEKVDEELKKNNVAGLLIGGALYKFHQDKRGKSKDLDVAILQPNSYQLPLQNIKGRVDYFDCRDRMVPTYLNKMFGRKDGYYTFRNSAGGRLESAALAFGYNSIGRDLKPGLIVPNLNFFRHIKRIEFEGMKDWGHYHEELTELLDLEKKGNLNGTYFGTGEVIDLNNFIVPINYDMYNELFGSYQTVGLIDYLSNRGKTDIRHVLEDYEKKSEEE